jgi:hypothetical protein
MRPGLLVIPFGFGFGLSFGLIFVFVFGFGFLAVDDADYILIRDQVDYLTTCSSSLARGTARIGQVIMGTGTRNLSLSWHWPMEGQSKAGANNSVLTTGSLHLQGLKECLLRFGLQLLDGVGAWAHVDAVHPVPSLLVIYEDVAGLLTYFVSWKRMFVQTWFPDLILFTICVATDFQIYLIYKIRCD